MTICAGTLDTMFIRYRVRSVSVELGTAMFALERRLVQAAPVLVMPLPQLPRRKLAFERLLVGHDHCDSHHVQLVEPDF